MDTSKILKKISRRKKQRTIQVPQQEETWLEIESVDQIQYQRNLAEMVLALCKRIGLRVEISSTTGNLRFSDYLTPEQQEALLGDDSDRHD